MPLINEPAVKEFKPSVCPLDCPDTCSLSVGISDDRIVEVRGSRANPYTAGAICEKVAKYYPAFVHGEHRLTRPLKRVGPRGSGEFEPIGWDEAIDRIHLGLSRVIDQFGPQSVLPLNYAGPHGQISGGSMDRRFFHQLGASLLDRGPLCGVVRGTAYTSLFGNAPGMPPEQIAESDVIAVWGNNVTVSNLHLARVIKSAREKNAVLIVIDPKRTRIAEQAHLYIQIRPGTDVVLALGLAAELEQRGALDHGFIQRWVEGYDSFMHEARKYSVAEMLSICAKRSGLCLPPACIWSRPAPAMCRRNVLTRRSSTVAVCTGGSPRRKRNLPTRRRFLCCSTFMPRRPISCATCAPRCRRP